MNNINDTITRLLEKSYEYARFPDLTFPDEYRTIHKVMAEAIEEMNYGENIRSVMRLRYIDGHKFIEISRMLGITYQWVYELHKLGVCFLEKHSSVYLTNLKKCGII